MGLGHQTPLLSLQGVSWALIKRNTDEGRCSFDNPREMLSKAALLSLYVLWLGSHFVVLVGYRQRILYCKGGPGYNMRRVLRRSPDSCALFLYPAAQDLWLDSCSIV